VDEAKGNILVATELAFNDIKTQLEILRFGEDIGIDTVLMHYPPSETFNSEEDVFDYTKRICDFTNLAIDLYPTHKYNFERFHPSTFSADLIARMAEFENVAGMKDGTLILATLLRSLSTVAIRSSRVRL